MENNDNGMFSVTPEEYTESDEKSSQETPTVNIEEFRNKAISDGYGETAIEEALKLADGSTKTYEDFEKLISKAVSNAKAEETEKAMKKVRLKESIELEVARLRKINDIAVYADSIIANEYNTSAVIAMNIAHRASDEDLQLDLYETPMYSIILQIKKDWVAAIVSDILADWETQDYPRQFVESYLAGLGVPEDKWEENKRDLLKILPDNIRNESSPDIYKQFRAVHIILQRKDPEEETDLADKIFSQAMQSVEYNATLEKAMEDGIPALAASAMATEAAIESMPEESRKKISVVGIAGSAGAFCGKVINLRYKTAKTFDDMLRENVGEYQDVWDANREAVRQRKAELKQRKAELKQEEKIAKMEAKAAEKVIREQERQAANTYRAQEQFRERQSRQQPYQQYNQNNRRQQQYRQNNNVNTDFNPNIPLPLVIAAVNMVIGLLTWAIFGKSTAIFCAIGLVIAFVGFLKREHQEQGAILTIIGGYALALVAMLIGLK